MEERLEKHLDLIDVSKFRLNASAMRQAYEFKKKHDPAFKNMTQSRFANMIGIGESTWKKLIAEDQALDAKCSTIWAAGKALGLDISVIFGLAPTRDYSLEERDYNPTLMDNMRRQLVTAEERLVAKKERIAELTEELAKRDAYEKELRERLLTVSGELSKEQQKNAAAPDVAAELQQVRKHKHTLAVCLFISAALTIAFGGMMIYLLWELQNPSVGNWTF